jgi:hypothetical protein
MQTVSTIGLDIANVASKGYGQFPDYILWLIPPGPILIWHKRGSRAIRRNLGGNEWARCHPDHNNGDCKMKLVTKDDMKVSRQNKPNAATTHAATKQNRIHRIWEKSADRTSIRGNQRIANWHKDVEALLISVQTAWAAAERMRLAVEEHDHDPETFETGGKLCETAT